MATLEDVARDAGVSKTTISRFLNNSIELPAATIARIEAAVISASAEAAAASAAAARAEAATACSSSRGLRRGLRLRAAPLIVMGV